MMTRVVLAASLALALSCCWSAVEAAEFKSGPQVGSKLPGAFHPLNIYNAELSDQSGKKNCLVCQHGVNPVAMVFARKNNDGLAALVKKLDAAVAAHKKEKLGAFVVFLTEGEQGAEDAVKDFMKATGVKNVSLAVDNPAGPKGYDIAKEAEITVVYYTKREIKVNHAYAAGKFDKAAAEKVAAEISKILGE
jgi:hypothetical protein